LGREFTPELLECLHLITRLIPKKTDQEVGDVKGQSRVPSPPARMIAKRSAVREPPLAKVNG
jgi:hypothetical protein